MKKIFTLILAITCFTKVAFAQTATEFVSKFVDDVIENILTADISKEKKTELFEEYVLNVIDTEAIARTVLAQYWRTAQPKERTDFINAFKNMAIKMTAERFNLYTGQKVNFFAERPAQGKNQVFVDSTVSGDTKPIQVVWRVREKDGNFYIIDLIIEGVSMALNYRNEYNAYLQNHSLQDLIDELNNQAEHATETVAEEQKTEE